MQPEKPGYLTTEFWVSVLTVGAILLKLFGIDISTDDINLLALNIAGLIAGSLAVWGIVSRYIKSRAETKVARLNAEITKLAVESGKPVTLSLGGK